MNRIKTFVTQVKRNRLNRSPVSFQSKSFDTEVLEKERMNQIPIVEAIQEEPRRVLRDLNERDPLQTLLEQRARKGKVYRRSELRKIENESLAARHIPTARMPEKVIAASPVPISIPQPVALDRPKHKWAEAITNSGEKWKKRLMERRGR